MISSSYRQECLCGRLFDDAGAFTRHKKMCLKGKKRLASVLAHAKESYHHKKCRVGNSEGSPSSLQDAGSRAASRTADEALCDLGPSGTPPSLVDAIQPSTTKIPNETAPRSGLEEVCILFFDLFGLIVLEPESGMVQAEDTLPLSLRRTRRTNCQLPKRFRDMLPEPPLPLPQGVEVLQADALHANSSSCPFPTAAFVTLSSQSFAQADPTTQSVGTNPFEPMCCANYSKELVRSISHIRRGLDAKCQRS